MADDLDPFGRPKDENPLASLGWDGDETASTIDPEPEATRPAEPAGEDRSARPPRRERPVAGATAADWIPEPPPDRRHEHERVEALLRSEMARHAGRGVSRLFRALIVMAIVVTVFAAIIGSLASEGVERADDFAREFTPPDIQVPTVPGADESRPSGRAQATLPARGLSVTSLLRPAAFRKAITKLRTGGYGRLVYLRVAADRIDATMLTKTGRRRQMQVVPGGAVRVIATSSSGFAGTPTMTMGGIDTGAPSRLTRSAAGRLEQPPSRVDYLVLNELAGERQWYVYFKGGPIFSADTHGRITRRVS